MENSNNFQGKNEMQYKNSTKFLKKDRCIFISDFIVT